MRALRVVVSSPLFDQDLGLAQTVEDFSVEQLIAESGVETLAVSVLPRRPRLDVGCLGANGRDPVPDGLGDEFRPVVRAYEGGRAAQDEEVRQGVDDVGGVQLAIHLDGQTFLGMFINDVQRPERPAIIGPAMDEVIGPDVIAMLRPQPVA